MENIDKISNEECGKKFKEIVNEYLSPSFGAMSKRELDILLFTKLQELGLFDEKQGIYDIVSSLKITRAKARNLIYESNLRKMQNKNLDEELRKIFTEPKFMKDSDKIMLEIDNPFLIDYLRFKLKEIGYITDGSFFSEIVKLTLESYVGLYKTLSFSKETVIDNKLLKNEDFKKILLSVAKHWTQKYIGDEGYNLLAPIFNIPIDKLKELVKGDKK